MRLGLQHQVAALGQALAGKVGLLQRDPSGAESLQVHAGAAGQPGQAHLQGRGDKDVQVVAGPQVGWQVYEPSASTTGRQGAATGSFRQPAWQS